MGATLDPDRPLDQCRHRLKPDFQPRYGNPVAMQATAKYVEIAKKCGISPTQLAYAFAVQRPFNACVIAGTTTVRQVQEAVSAAHIDLSPEVLKELDIVHEQFRNPTIFDFDKESALQGTWLGTDNRAAREPEV